MSGRWVLLLCGPAFSGKSTLASELSEQIQFPIVSLDALNAARGLGAGFDVSTEEWSRTHEIALAELEQLLAGNAPGAVIDDTNCFRFLRDNYRAVAERHGVPAVVITLKADIEELRSRVERSPEVARARGIDPAKLERHLRDFEWPQEDERAIEFERDGDAEWWITRRLVPAMNR
jgi:predicted kinase